MCDQAEEIGLLENSTIEIIDSENQKESEQKLNTIKYTNILLDYQKEKRKTKGKEIIFKEMVAENFQT